MPPLKEPRPKFLKHPGAQAKLDKPHHPGKPDLDKRKERKPEKKPQKLVESHPLEHRHGRAARRVGARFRSEDPDGDLGTTCD